MSMSDFFLKGNKPCIDHIVFTYGAISRASHPLIIVVFVADIDDWSFQHWVFFVVKCHIDARQIRKENNIIQHS